MMRASAPVAPFDPAIPGLSVAFDRKAMALRLAPLAARVAAQPCPTPDGWRIEAVEILKHKPGRRCALGYVLTGPSGPVRLFAKAFCGERGAAILETMSRLAAAIPAECLLVPKPIGYLPDLRLLVTEFLEGIPLASALYEGRSNEPVSRMAAALRAMHDSDVTLARRWSASHELSDTGRWVDGLAARDPAMHTIAQQLHSTLSSRAPRLPASPLQPIHRDYYAEQVLDCSGRTALLDLDDARLGDPALDLGNFLAHLTLRSLQFPHLARGCAAARALLMEAYRSAGAKKDETLDERVSFYEAASLLRLSGVYAERERWARVMPSRLLDACVRTISRVREGGVSCGGSRLTS